MLKAIPKGIWEWDLENGEMIWTDEIRKFFGVDWYSGKPTYDLWLQSVMPGDRIRIEQIIQMALAKKEPFAFECRIADSKGANRKLMTQGFPVRNDDGQVKRYMGATIEITKNFVISDHLIKTSNLSTLLYFCKQPLCVIGRDGKILAANKAFGDHYARESYALKGRDFHKLFRPELQDDRKAKFDVVFSTGGTIHFKDRFLEKEAGKNKGKESIYQISAYPVYSEDDSIKSLAVFVAIDNKHTLAEQARIELDKQYQTLIAASPDSIITTDLEGIISSVSDIGLEIFGANKKTEVIGQPFSRIVYSENYKIIDEIFDVTLREGLIQNREILLKKKNNSVYSAEISAALIHDFNGAPSSYMMIIRDISQRKIIESELFHAKRLISLGEMASGIAHEIYQPINNIGLVVDKMLMNASKNDWSCKQEIKTTSDKIFENIIRVQTIIDNIRSFSSTDNNYISSVVNINKSINNALLMVSEQCKHRSIILEFKHEEERFTVTGNIYKFEQVILNLIRNSIDAIEERKQISQSPFEMKIIIRSFHDNGSVTVSVEDTGIGISEKNIEYIMHPFYTTKESGKGTGLGLSISYGIIKEMNGDIKIESKPMNGTCVHITLPKTITGVRLLK